MYLEYLVSTSSLANWESICVQTKNLRCQLYVYGSMLTLTVLVFGDSGGGSILISSLWVA
jgi:hypothetical protein